MPRPLRTLRSLAAGAALALLLASCGIIESLAGPQQLSDPLGLHDRDVTLESGVAPAASTPQATRSYEAVFGPVPVPDIDASGIPDWFDPNSLHIDVGFMATVRLASTSALDGSEFSETFVLDGATLAGLAIEDDDGASRVELDPVSTPATASVTLEKQSCSTVPPVSCTYAARSGLDAFVMAVDVAGTAMDDLYAILTSGSATNTASGALQVAATGTAPSNTTITVTIDAPSGVLHP